MTEKIVLEFTGGPLGGSSVMGEVAWDDAALTGVGMESISPGSGFLSFDVMIGADTFVIEDDIDFPIFPNLFFLDGALVDVGFFGGNIDGAGLDIFAGAVTYFPASPFEDPSFGIYGVGSSPFGVPDAGIGTMAFALLFGGMFAVGRKRR